MLGELLSLSLGSADMAEFIDVPPRKGSCKASLATRSQQESHPFEEILYNIFPDRRARSTYPEGFADTAGPLVPRCSIHPYFQRVRHCTYVLAGGVAF